MDIAIFFHVVIPIRMLIVHDRHIFGEHIFEVPLPSMTTLVGGQAIEQGPGSPRAACPYRVRYTPLIRLRGPDRLPYLFSR